MPGDPEDSRMLASRCAEIAATATTPVLVMGTVMEAGKLAAVAWLGANKQLSSASRAGLAAMIALLMALNGVGVFGFLSRAHLQYLSAARITVGRHEALAAAELEAAMARVADLDMRIGQIDGAVLEATKRGRTNSAMELAGSQRKTRALPKATTCRPLCGASAVAP
jgi:hypothetical protein